MIKGRIQIKALSVNNAWKGHRFKTKAYKDYSQIMALLLPRGSAIDGRLAVAIIFGYSNVNADIDNGVKPLLDLMQAKYGFNDRDVYSLDVTKQITTPGQEFIDFKIQPI